MGLLYAIAIIIKIKAPDSTDLLENMQKIIIFSFWNIISYVKTISLAHLLCHVTYVKAFNKCSDPGVKLANLWFFII